LLVAGCRDDGDSGSAEPATISSTVGSNPFGLIPSIVKIGNLLGFESTVTAGIISRLHREIPAGGTTRALGDLIQTDAPISPGNEDRRGDARRPATG
jgi:S1-C subfamily serine protease